MSSNIVSSLKSPKFERPLCAEVDPEMFFPEDEDEEGVRIPIRRVVANQGTYLDAKKICDKCEHKVECADWAIRHEPYGFWGGLSPNQRRTARRRLNIRISVPY